jgi:hypothetical protein
MELVQEESNTPVLAFLFLSFPFCSDHFRGLLQSAYRMDCNTEMFFVLVEAGTSVKEHTNPELTCHLWNEVTTEINSASKKNRCLVVIFEKRWCTEQFIA